MTANPKLLLLAGTVSLLCFSAVVRGQERRNTLLQPMVESPTHQKLANEERRPVVMRPLLQPTSGENNHGKSQDESNLSQNKGTSNRRNSNQEATKTGSGLFGMVRTTTPTPSPERPTVNIKSGLLKPASPDSPDASSRRPIVKRPTRRPALAQVQPRPTQQPAKLLVQPTGKSSTVQTTRRASTLLSSSRRRPQSSSTTSAPKLENYRSLACELQGAKGLMLVFSAAFLYLFKLF
ncbi:uncharacterized protein LOC108677956 [Hyalella azteca]|uniref:Uncharacterized protein LOC108677956 n=1 Tax=Hyalella azteca TaxID=294128 RepID=A0A8B7P6H5_HYAAZ|nr:uncharacterized protein LOC108677956 [Hyalella azteca]